MEKLRLLTLLFLTVVIAACQKDPTQNGSSDPDVVSFQGSVSFKTVDPAEKGLDLIWNADVDRIGLFAADGETVEHANIYYAAFSSAANTQFVCPSQDRRIVWSAGAASRDFYAYYPYRTTYDDLTAVPVAIAAKQKGAAGATKHLKQLVNLYAVSKGVKGPVETVSLPFESVAAVIELRLAADRTLSDVRNITLRSTDGGMLAFETGSLNLRNGAVTPGEQTAAEINYEIEGQATISRTPTSFFLAVNPVEAGKTLEVLVDYGEKHLSLGSVVVPESGIPGGKLTVFSLGYEFPQRIAEDLSANGTANTYLVTKPGTTYKFRATTKGNGVPRTYSYSVDGHPVTKSYSETDLAIKPMAAKLVWYNSPKTADGWVRESPVTIESVEYDDWEGNVYFTTPAEFVPGNALIAAYDAGGEVLWSWNIWAVENYDCDAEARQVGRYMMMDRNLGAMAGREAMNSSDKRVAAWALGNYYQWGRKDPFYGGEKTETSANAFLEAKNGTVVNPAYPALDWAFSKSATTTDGAAANPMTFYNDKVGTGYNWLASPNATLWSEAKTLNDPCPPGYRVPETGAWEDLISGRQYIDGVSVWDGTNYGMTYTHGEQTAWYPAQGYRNYSSGAIVGLRSSTGGSGAYWSAETSSVKSYYLFFRSKLSSSGSINNELDMNRSYGYTVRCCKE